MPQPSIPGPLGEFDLRDQPRLDPHRALELFARHLHEGRLCAFERLELAGKRIEVGRIEAGADLAGIDQSAVLETAEQKGREGLAPHLRAAVAADDEFFAARGLDLEPVSAATGNIGPVGTLRHDAFEPCRGGLREEFGSGALHIIGIDEEVGDAPHRHQLCELRAPLDQRFLAPVLAVERQEIEHEIADGGVRRIDMLLQRFEGGQARRQHEGDLSVDQRDLGWKCPERLGDGRESHRPVEPASAEQRDVVAGLPRDDAVAVVLRFMQPTAARRHLGVERRELWLDELRD